MADNYVIDIISDKNKQDYLNNAQLAIGNLRKKIAELQQMIRGNTSMPTMNAAYEVAFYIKDIIGIPNRESQDDMTSGAENENYYIRFIPTNNQDVVIDLRISDHIRGEEWSDKKDGGAHPNIRASAIVQDTDNVIPKASVQKPHKVNGCKVKRFLQQIPTTVYGTPEQVIKHLNTLICLFQNGKFGKYKVNKQGLNCNRNMNKKLIKLTEADLHRIVRESVNNVLKETIIELATPQNGKRQLEKLYNKIMSLIEPIQDKGSLDKNSTYWIVSKIHYDVKFDGKSIRVRRTEIERGGKTYKDSWILTERNWVEKWKDSYGNPLSDQIKYDRKCARFFENEYGSDYEF